MLTHDMEPIIDTIKSLSDKFRNQTSASFLKLAGGNVSELAIEKDDIQTFSQICKNVLSSDRDDIVKMIYMRRDFEISDNNGDAYQVLANVLHKRKCAIDARNSQNNENKHPKMDEDKFVSGCKDIQSQLANFKYTEILNKVSDVNTLKSLYEKSENGYEKLQIFRLLGLNVANSVIQKFINETYHIENEFICQLDPTQFDTIPEYVINECNKLVQEAQ